MIYRHVENIRLSFNFFCCPAVRFATLGVFARAIRADTELAECERLARRTRRTLSGLVVAVARRTRYFTEYFLKIAKRQFSKNAE